MTSVPPHADSRPTATILVVDDDRGLVRLLERALRRGACAVHSAASGQAAIDWLGHQRADLMLLDLNLPDISGGDLITRLRERDCAVPFVVITGHGDLQMAVEMMKRGAVDYLVKDRQFLDLVPPVVERAIAQVAQEQRLAAAEAALRASEERFRVALKNSPITVFTQDRALRYTWVHNFPLDPTGQSVLGRTTEDLLPTEEATRVTAMKRQVIETGVGARGEVRWTIANHHRTYDLTVEPLRDAQGQIQGVTCAAMDITARKHLEQEISLVREREQRRIGQDLHDGLCQHLAGIEFMSQVLQQKLAAKSKPEAAAAAEIAKLVREGIAHTRDLARGLAPVVLESEGLMSALQELAERMTKLFQVDCRFRCEAPVLIHDHTVATHLYRIAQEALANAVKHGKPTRVEISLNAKHGPVTLAIEDNGRGMAGRRPTAEGMGLRIMNYRAGMMGATLAVHSPAHGGTRVTCTLNPPPSPVP